jgi:hypothetical protein
MRHLLLLLLAVVFSSPFALAAQNPEPVRLCVAVLENRSHQAVTPEWQQKEFIRALERTNKNKEVKKSTAARITAVALESTSGPDAKVQKEGCGFVLYTELVDVQSVGTARVGTTPPGAIGTSVTVGKVYEPPDLRRLLHDATVNYRIVRGGDPESWASGIVTAKDTVTEDALVSRLMDQIASRAASELRKPHPSTPE